MKVAVHTRYGGPEVIEVQDRERPTPKDGDILIRVVASSITRADTMMREGKPYIGRLFLGLLKQKNTGIGAGFSGEIVAVGTGVKNFKIADLVYGESIQTFGANAEYLCINQNEVVRKKPRALTHEQACCVCDGILTSYSFLKDIGKLKSTQKILINGASGSLGSAAVQIAKYLGAEVTGVCGSSNVEFVKSLGSDKVIDYTKENFTDSNERYDVIYDSVGTCSFSACKKVLKAEGIFLSPVLSCELLFQTLYTAKIKPKKAIFSATGLRKIPELMKLLDELTIPIEEGKILPHIDKCFTLYEIAKAHNYVNKGHKRGSVVITSLPL